MTAPSARLSFALLHARTLRFDADRSGLTIALLDPKGKTLALQRLGDYTAGDVLATVQADTRLGVGWACDGDGTDCTLRLDWQTGEHDTRAPAFVFYGQSDKLIGGTMLCAESVAQLVAFLLPFAGDWQLMNAP